ncbi:MAG: BNR/Asp-box repeat protein [Bacteroidota bacterium]|nr:BNR/Asp-box repeat protein [Bacteroidota bacterium]
MKLTNTPLAFVFCLLFVQLCRAQVATPPETNLTTSATITVGGNAVSISANGYSEVINVMNEWTSVPTKTYTGYINGGNIVSISPKPGAGHENQYYVLFTRGEIALHTVTIVNNTIHVSGKLLGRWNLAVNSTGFKKIAGDALYVLNNGIVGETIDSTATWTYDTTGAPNILDFAMDTAQGLYAVGSTGKLFYQPAIGTSWSQLSGFPSGQSPQSVYVDRRNRVFVGTNANGVYYSTNAGSSFTQGNTGLGSQQCRRMCDDIFGNVYMINNGGTEMYRSSDGGNSWVRIDTAITNRFAPAQGFPVFINDVRGDSVLQVASAAGRFFTRDQGTTWVMDNSGLRETYLNGFYKTGTGRLVETSNNGVFYLDAGNNNWQRPLPTDGYASAGRLYADTIGNIYVTAVNANSAAQIMKSNDNGTTWQPDTLGLYQITANAGGYYVDEAGNQHLANDNYSTGATCYTKAPGASFVPDTLGIGIPHHLYDNINAFGTDRAGYLYLSGTFTGTPNVWRRPVAGGTWVPDTAGIGTNTFLGMISDHNHTVIGSPMISHSGIWYRNNSGVWTSITTPSVISAFANVTAMAADNSGGLLVAFSAYDFSSNSSLSQGIFCTHDYGATWNHVGLDSFYITQLVNNGDSTYALAQGGGIFALTCAGVVGDITTGIAQSEPVPVNQLTLYPNPTSGTCHMRVNEAFAAQSLLAIYDITGKMLFQLPVPEGAKEMSFDTHNIPSGIYFCVLKSNNASVAVKKLVVKK